MVQDCFEEYLDYVAQVRKKSQHGGAGLPTVEVGQGIPSSPCPAAALAISHSKGTKSFFRVQLWCLLCKNSGAVEAAPS